MAKALPAFLRRESSGPSTYTVERNAQKDQDARDREARIKAHEDATLKISEDNLELSRARRRDEQARHDLEHARAMNELAAKELKTEMEKIHVAREGLFLQELHNLPTNEIASREKARALIGKYHGLEKLTPLGAEALKDWNDAMKITVQDEMVKQKAIEAKKAAAEEKRVAVLTDRHRRELDKAGADLNGALAARSGLTDESKPADITRVNGQIANAHERLTHAAERLKKVSPDDAPEVDDRMKEAATGLLRDTLQQHDKAAAELDAVWKGGMKPNDPKLVAARAKLNAIKKQLPGFDLVDEQTGVEKKGSAALPVPSSSAAPAPAAQPAAANPAPVEAAQPGEDSWNSGQQPAAAAGAQSDAERKTAIAAYRDKRLLPAVTPTGKPLFAPPSNATSTSGAASPEPSPEPPYDPWADVAQKRDAAIDKRDKNLNILTGTPLLAQALKHPIDTLLGQDKIATASTSASVYGDIANDAQDTLEGIKTRTAADNHARLVANLGGQQAYDTALAEHRAKSAPVVAAPVAPVPVSSAADAPAEAAPASSTAEAPAAAAPKVIRMKLDADGNLVPVT